MKPNYKARVRASGKRIVDRLVRGVRRVPGTHGVAEELFRSWYGLSVPPTNYYSPLPDLEALEKTRSRWYRASTLPGIEIDEDAQRRYLDRLTTYASEQAALPSFDEVQAAGFGQGYGPVEAMLLHSVVRDLKPRRIMEIGCGVSTFFMLEANRRNEEDSGQAAEITCIEPYGTDLLRQLTRERGVKLHESEAQDVSLDTFGRLGDGDLLFIDSTHVSKIDSDVQWLYLEVLPRLSRGVVIHIHDIPFPHLSVPPNHPLHRLSLLWNESALVQALLCGNRDFEILMCQSLLHERAPDVLRRAVPSYDPQRHFPSALWLRKTRDVA